MSGPESRAWRELVRAAQRFDPTIHMERVENAVGPGTPDISFACAATRQSGWIELKVMPTLKAAVRSSFGLSPGQRKWLRTWTKAGGTAWVLVRFTEEARLKWLAVKAEWALSYETDEDASNAIMSNAIASDDEGVLEALRDISGRMSAAS